MFKRMNGCLHIQKLMNKDEEWMSNRNNGYCKGLDQLVAKERLNKFLNTFGTFYKINTCEFPH